jgi:hypothetical protein
MNLANRAPGQTSVEQFAQRELDLLWRKRPKPHSTDVRQNPSDAEVVVLVGFRPDAVADRICQPVLQVERDRLVPSKHELPSVRLTLRLHEPGLDNLPGAGEELLSAVGQSQIGDPAAVLAGIDRAFAVAASRYSRSGHEVDILPSTRTQWNALNRGSTSYRRAGSEVLLTVKELANEGFEVAFKNAARAPDPN